ncbi:dTDP-4-dehydrorhamnose reductase [Sunxiuqinia dokdonensis]|uniref:dTDP-4-dehydrorhamnose reductase n=1 Tax=Sunxiuqinia dokdonensis TaxID=1409788 RepID=A0A0L8VA12_9BACT|nr:dTDP-4-dehydrorhamnose reductase [Sunxiuqinia dokdonensis]KOH45183.1 dTDP-4-dehydrorhamnose reductase [Sunxiuqinia dokdonensis]
MVKILVTGADGQLGSEIRRLANRFQDFHFLFTDINELDLTDQAAVSQFVGQEAPDYIINCAAYTAVDIAEEDTELAALINTKVPALLGKLAQANNIKVIHISTDYVFDGTSFLPYTENDLVNPESIYGKSKLNGEIALLKEAPSAMVIRTSWLYSSHGKNFVKTMVKLGEDRDELRVVADQVGTPTFAGDLAEAILTIISKTKNNVCEWKPGIYHYSNEGVCSWYDFAKAIHELYGINCLVHPIPTEEYPTAAARPPYSVLNKSKIKRIFGVQIPYWRDSLKKCITELKK